MLLLYLFGTRAYVVRNIFKCTFFQKNLDCLYYACKLENVLTFPNFFNHMKTDEKISLYGHCRFQFHIIRLWYFAYCTSLISCPLIFIASSHGLDLCNYKTLTFAWLNTDTICGVNYYLNSVKIFGIGSL